LLKRVAESIASEYPCALIRGLLSPGHSTVPGDLLNVRREDWYQTFAFGVSGFFNLVESLYVVGYSNGSVLALNYLDRNRDSAAISGLILLSPGLKTRDTRAFLSPWLKYGWKWINQSPDQDAVKYESFPMSAAAEFYHLTEDVTRAGFGSLSLPVLMVVSGDDTTIDNQYSVDFFCNKLDADSRKMIWYQSGLGSGNPEGICSGIELIPPAQTDRFISYSHVAITMPPTDPHYGMDGNYSACLTYTSEPDIFLRCREDNAATVYAENSYLDEARSFAGKLVRRTTFNPAYNEMISELSCFVNSDCTEEESSR
jgi:esterase/lipase